MSTLDSAPSAFDAAFAAEFSSYTPELARIDAEGSGSADVDDSSNDRETPDQSERPANTDAEPNDPDDDADPDGDDPNGEDESPETDDDAAPDLESGEPFTYTANGEAKTMEGVTIVPGYGAVIDEAAIPQIQQRLAERDTFDTQLQQHTHRLDQYDKYSAWHIPQQDGSTRTLTGPEAIEARMVQMGRNAADIDLVETVLNDPTKLADLLTLDQAGNIVANPVAMRNLQTERRLAQMEAEGHVRAHFQGIQREQQQVQQAAPENFWAAAERAWLPDFPQLTPQDKAFLQSQVGQYLRPATPNEVRNGQAKQGEMILDQKFHAVIKYQAEQRQGAATTAVTAGKVATENANRRAGVLPNKNGARPTTGQRRDRETGKFVEKHGKKERDVMWDLSNGKLPDVSDDD